MGSFLFLKIAEDPLIFSVPTGWTFAAGVNHCRRLAAGRNFYVVAPVYWDVATTTHLLTQHWGTCRRLYPEMKLVFLCPQQSDVERLSYLGMDAVHASHSAFIDETIFFPDPAVEKTFTAVINANMAAWKRHELAWGVERLALITYLQDGQTPAAGIAGYQSLAFSNRTEDGGVIGLTAQEVAAVLRKSWCGLMLSELEGANFASAEYLFCGLPLVTTPSRGGRHALYSSRYVKVVAPRTEAVATGVALAQDWPVPPEVIHAEVLARCIPHRRRLLDWLSRVMEKDAHAMANQNAWLPSYRDKLREVFVL